MTKHKDVHPVQAAAHAYVGAFMDELVHSGVSHVVLCPGSRSTPLALMATEHESLRMWTHIDERSAGFFALGLAKATETPVALIATSGTAVANFLPAVTEAFFGRVPLVLLTADRPPELRDVGSNQTIHQARVFGDHVKWAVDMPLPEAGDELVRYARGAAARAVATARAQPSGPVQLNFPLREPLIPLPASAPLSEREQKLERYRRSLPSVLGEPAVAERGIEVWDGPRGLTAEAAATLADELERSRRPLFVCGPDTPRAARQPLIDLAARLRIPLLADPLSGLRTTGTISHELIDAYDVFLRFDDVVHAVPPSLVVRFGAVPVSKPLLQYLARYADKPQIVVDEGGGWRDPLGAASRVIYADAAGLCEQLLDALDEAPTSDGSVDGPDALGLGSGSSESAVEALARAMGAEDGESPDAEASSPHVPAAAPAPRRAHPWPVVWRRLNDVAREHLEEQLQHVDEPFEGAVFDALSRSTLPDINLYVGNSMPVRDMDTFFKAGERRWQVFGHRGVSGIDGIVSGALGVSAANGAPTVLVLGDLSFYHDLNGLLAASVHGLDITIVVVNNDGGGIFSFLPQAEHGRHFEALFGTPTGLDFAPVVAMYGGEFSRTERIAELQEKLEASVRRPGLDVIEFVTDREQNAARHRALMAAVGEKVTGMLGDIFRSAVSDG